MPREAFEAGTLCVTDRTRQYVCLFKSRTTEKSIVI